MMLPLMTIFSFSLRLKTSMGTSVKTLSRLYKHPQPGRRSTAFPRLRPV